MHIRTVKVICLVFKTIGSPIEQFPTTAGSVLSTQQNIYTQT